MTLTHIALNLFDGGKLKLVRWSSKATHIFLL